VTRNSETQVPRPVIRPSLPLQSGWAELKGLRYREATVDAAGGLSCTILVTSVEKLLGTFCEKYAKSI